MPTTKPPRIKNYLSTVPVEQSLTIIRKALASHKAKRITFEQDAEGLEIGIQFEIQIGKETFTFRLPVRFDGVKPLVEKAWREMGKPLKPDALEAQARITAWANIRDWVLAQMALIDASQVQLAEVFFPYTLSGEHTYFEEFAQRLALPAPKFSISEVTER